MPGKPRGRPFEKGRSGNPSGRPKVPDDVREMAKALTPEVIQVQSEIMRDEDAPAAARITAAENIINRAYGKPEGNLNLTMTAGQAFIEMLRMVNEQRAQAGTVANGVDQSPERSAEVRH